MAGEKKNEIEMYLTLFSIALNIRRRFVIKKKK